MNADYVIVGGGSAGLVLANRLSEDPSVRVVLLEAGGEARSLLVQIPVGFARLVGHETYDWKYEQEPDPSIGGRHFLWSGGKLLGGGSSINGQVYIRGTRQDYDHWAEGGATGWGFKDVMPYFLRSEHWWGEPSQVHGEHGPLSVAPMRDFHPMCRVFLNGCAEVGLPTLGEYNGGDMEGAFLTQATQRNGWRCSTEKAFLRPVRSRPNLRVVTYAEADRVLFEGRRATGVAFTRAGVRQQVNAKRELIVSAGSMGSPALLMRSGVGPGADLRAAGIPVIKDLPQVGGNLQEHCAAGQSRLVNRPTLNSQVGPLDMASHAVRFMFGRKGPFGAPAVQAMAMARTRDDLNEPDVQLNFLPLIYDIAPDSTSSASVRMSREPAVTISATVAHPHSRGRVVLGPDKRARIAHQLIGDPRDVGTLVGAMKLIERVFDTKAFADCVTAHRTPPSSPASDEAWAEFVRSKAVIVYHPVGTCRMGSDPEAVVDPQLRVNGVGALRVADASIMPRVTSTNTNAPTIMIGEKAAEMVRGAAP